MTMRPVRTSLPVDTTRVHLFQVVREHLDDRDVDWIVVGLSGDRVDLASVGFDWHRTISFAALEEGAFEPRYMGDVPVWGY